MAKDAPSRLAPRFLALACALRRNRFSLNAAASRSVRDFALLGRVFSGSSGTFRSHIA